MTQPRAALMLAVVALSCGCSTSTYFVRRGQDLADCVEAGVGFGALPVEYALWPYARAKATDFAVVSCGTGASASWGLLGRYRGKWGGMRENHAGFPPFMTYERRLSGVPMREVTVHTLLPFCTTRTYDGWAEPGPRGKIAEKFWIGAQATLLSSARPGVNPLEFADFLVGCLGWDMLQDDDWSPKEDQTKEDAKEGN